MNTTTPAVTTSTPPAYESPPAPPTAPEDRGRTVITSRVLERIAAHTLTEVAHTGGSARRLLGMPLGRDTQQPAQVHAHIDGHLATVHMTISVHYPAPVRQVTRQLRQHITTRIGELTGLEVRQVDIDIARLTRPGHPPRHVQ